MLVVCHEIDEAVAVKVGEAAATAPEEGGGVIEGVRVIRDVLVHGTLSDTGPLVVAVFVAVDDQLTPRAEGGRLSSADVLIPEDAVGLVRQHQVGQAVAVPVDVAGVGVTHVVRVTAAQDLVALQADGFALGVDQLRLGEGGLAVRARIAHDSRPAVAAADEQVGHPVAIPVTGAGPALVGERHGWIGCLGASPGGGDCGTPWLEVYLEESDLLPDVVLNEHAGTTAIVGGGDTMRRWWQPGHRLAVAEAGTIPWQPGVPEDVAPRPGIVAIGMLGDGRAALDETDDIESAVAGDVEAGDALSGTQVVRLAGQEGPALRVGVTKPLAIEDQVEHPVTVEIDERHGVGALLGHGDLVAALPDGPAAAVDLS